jgi:hypothetical protein
MMQQDQSDYYEGCIAFDSYNKTTSVHSSPTKSPTKQGSAGGHHAEGGYEHYDLGEINLEPFRPRKSMASSSFIHPVSFTDNMYQESKRLST